MIDRTTKALLLVIALGVWFNTAVQWLQPHALQAQTPNMIEFYVRQIATGVCTNHKIC